MFRLVTQSSLAHEEDRRALALLRAELHKLQGQAQEMEDELRAISWPEDHAASVYVHKLQGDALEMRGQLEQALQHYRQALQAFGDSAQLEATRLHARMSYIYRSRYHDIDQARQAALHAQFTAEIFRGNVEEGDGNYNMARMHHLAALSLAETMMNSDESVADSYTNLGRISWRLGNAAESVDHLQKAIQYDQQRGNTISLLHDRQNLSAAYIVAGDYEAALGQVELGMNLAEKLNHAYLIAGFAVNAGEACFHLNRLDEAEGYAMRALQQEENAMQPYALTVLGQVQHARGQLTQGVATLCAAIDAAQHIQDRFAEAPAWRALAAAYLAQQRNEEALQAFDKAINQFQDLGLAHEVNATERLQANSSSPHAP
jgi:tetratricopeptide (TPR) repeat protein